MTTLSCCQNAITMRFKLIYSYIKILYIFYAYWSEKIGMHFLFYKKIKFF